MILVAAEGNEQLRVTVTVILSIFLSVLEDRLLENLFQALQRRLGGITYDSMILAHRRGESYELVH